MKLRHGLTALAFTAAVAFGFAANAGDNLQKNAALKSNDRGDAEQAQKGKALYAEHCSHCHGFNMVTAGTVAFDLRQFPHNDKTRFVTSVTDGKNNRMPAWGDVLKPEEIDELWAYVLTGGKG
jgi:mono/diheme cytochrome c family protein